MFYSPKFVFQCSSESPEPGSDNFVERARLQDVLWSLCACFTCAVNVCNSPSSRQCPLRSLVLDVKVAALNDGHFGYKREAYVLLIAFCTDALL